MHMRYAKPVSALVLALLATVTLSACGDDDDGDNSPAASSSSAATSQGNSSAPSSDAASSDDSGGSVTSSSSSSSSSASSDFSSDSSSSDSSSSAASSDSSSSSSSSATSSSSSSSSAASVEAFFDSTDLVSGKFSFNNDSTALKYLVGATADTQGGYTLDGTQQATGQQFIYGYPNTTPTQTSYNGTKLADAASTIAGVISIPKAGSSTKGDYATGGAVVFKLPSCSKFAMTVEATGDIYYAVYTSIDGINWSQKTAPTSRFNAKGTYSTDITSYVTSSAPIYVKIVNGGSGTLYIHDVTVAK